MARGDTCLLTGLEEKQRQDEREREQRPLPPGQLGQGLLPHGAKRHLNLRLPTWEVVVTWSWDWLKLLAQLDQGLRLLE